MVNAVDFAFSVYVPRDSPMDSVLLILFENGGVALYIFN